MKYSILVMAYDPDGVLTEMTSRCVESVISNSKGKEYELFVDFDTGGVEKKVNRFYERARGEYLIFLNNDSVISDPEWLDKLCIPDTITSNKFVTFFLDGLEEPEMGLCSIPKNVQERVGLFDERFNEGYGFSDNDYMRRARLARVPFEKVDIPGFTHEGSKTFSTYFSHLKQDMTEKNQRLFVEKWASQ